jgi:hypothetical protein
VTARQAYRLLGRLLGPDEVGRRRRPGWAEIITSDRLSWERLIEISSRHLVTPALPTALGQKGVIDLIPADLHQFLTGLRLLNIQRNEALAGQIVEIGRALNDEGIEPILLKGAAHLHSGLYADSGDRVLGDLDVLIPAEAAREAYLALVKLGYQGYFQTKPGDPYHDHHHLPPLEHPARKAAVELHTEPVNKRYRDVLSPAEMRADSIPLEIQGGRWRRPSLTHQAVHLVLHFQSTRYHVRWFAQRFPLRHLLDLTLIRRAAGDQIDWPGVRERFQRGGQGRALRLLLALAEGFLGQARPAGFRLRPGDRAVRAWLLGWALRR